MDWFLLLLLLFFSLDFSSRTKATGTKGGERLNSMNKTRDQSSSSGMECEISIIFFFSLEEEEEEFVILLLLGNCVFLEKLASLEKKKIISNFEFSRNRDLFIYRGGGKSIDRRFGDREERGEGGEKGRMKIRTNGRLTRKTHLRCIANQSPR